ncbi:MAG TPA: DUF4335 domain-containing protein [Coleofasciculaceae cyanobacterium]
MTIRRQYSLPNCTLVLEGLNEGTGIGGVQMDARPLMTILVQAECYLVGQEKPLTGGRDFFESLVKAVSGYAQEFLSQVHHPKLHGEAPTMVQLQPLKEKNLHRLTLLPTDGTVPTVSSVGMGATASPSLMPLGTPAHLDLTTVQLFDLVEAIDQFLADQRTLPDVKVEVEPLPKRYRKADQPIVERATPAALGITSLAVAAIALFLVPIPQVREPKPTTAQPNAETSSPSPNGESQATATPSTTPPATEDLEKALTATPEITDPTQLRFLQRGLYNKLNQSWKNRNEVAQNLEYQVGVGKDGAIVGYKPVKDTPIDAAQQTPLPELLYKPTTGSIANQEPIAQYRVVFNRRGILQISPWRGYVGKPTLGPEITDASLLRELNDKLYNQIIENRKGTPTYPRALDYRVAVTKDGTIADYEPLNTPAWDYIQETPLETLAKPEAAGIGSESAGLPKEELAQYRVVFRPSGVLEVSPLRGYR